jgi:hypothetical protein
MIMVFTHCVRVSTHYPCFLLFMAHSHKMGVHLSCEVLRGLRINSIIVTQESCFPSKGLKYQLFVVFNSKISMLTTSHCFLVPQILDLTIPINLFCVSPKRTSVNLIVSLVDLIVHVSSIIMQVATPRDVALHRSQKYMDFYVFAWLRSNVLGIETRLSAFFHQFLSNRTKKICCLPHSSHLLTHTGDVPGSS